jgi:microcystin-dependent protein
LTDAGGDPLADGSKVVQFKIYDAPVGGKAVWNGEVQKLTVNGGLVNTTLGTKASLANVDFNKSLYLELTIDANNDDQITAADPPLLPRQSILPAVFANESANSRLLGGYDWSTLFGTNNPASGTFLDSKIRDGSINASKIRAASIDASLLVGKTITAAQIAAGTITSNEILAGTIDLDKLALRVVEALSPAGEITAFGGLANKVPSGWLLCDGRVVSSGQYPRLYAAISTNWGAGIPGSTNDFNLPDMRGIFLRGVDGNAGRDPDKGSRTNSSGLVVGNAVGSLQSDAFQGHHHGLYYYNYSGAGGGGSSALIRAAPDEFQNTNGPTKAVREPTIDGTHGTPRISSETRPMNAYVNYVIKY